VAWAFFHLVERRFQNSSTQPPAQARAPEAPARRVRPVEYAVSLREV